MTNKNIPLPPDSRPCPCGALADKPHLLCSKCRARSRWSRRKQHRQGRAAGGYAYRIERRIPDGSWSVIATGELPSGRHPDAVARGLLERRVLDQADRRLGGMAIVDRNALTVSDAHLRVIVMDRDDRTTLVAAALAPIQEGRRIPRQRRSMNTSRRNRKEGSR